jgi:pteridine reductase
MGRKKSISAKKKPSAALITGGAVRLGRTLALRLAAEGYDIALHYNTSAKAAEKTKQDVEKCGVRCRLYKADLAKSKQDLSLVAQAKKDFPALNLLINSASIFERSRLMETSEALFDRHMAINFKAPFFLTQAFAKHAKKGQVINILDTYVTKDTESYFAYLLSKKALFHFTRMAARELAPHIRVNAVAPGTTGQSKEVSGAYLKAKQQRLPMQQLVTFEEITDAVLLLAGSTLTGQCIFADSGEQLV